MRAYIGDKVRYKNKEYQIIHMYATDYCEIREVGTYRIILVHLTEIEILK